MTWTSSTDSEQVIAAWVAALASLEDIIVDARVEAGPMRYKYATLGRVLDEVRPKLAAHDLVLTQYVSDEGVATLIFHKSGQWISFPPFKIHPVGGTPQHVGSATSYARRYSILSICNLATEDDDGAAASVSAVPETATADDPITIRVNAALATMKGLDVNERERMKAWADGRSLSPRALYENPDWLSEVEAILDEGLGLTAETEGDDDDNGDDDNGEHLPE